MRKKKPLPFWSLVSLPLLCGCLCLAVILLNPNPYTTLTIDGVEREYILHLPPSYNGSTPYPLVFVFHGGGGQARNMPRFTGFSALADEEDFIVVYPNGLERGWSDGRVANRPERLQIDDVAFIEALLDKLDASYDIDPDRIYTTGISNGGFFSQRLLCEMSERFAAGAVLTAAMSTELLEICNPAAPSSLMFINGTADPLVPYAGGAVVSDRGVVLSTDKTVAWWAETQGCLTGPTVLSTQDDDPADETALITSAYTDCEGGGEVVLMRVEGGGHTWPGGSQYLPVRTIGVVSREIDAAKAIWAFFETHPTSR